MFAFMSRVVLLLLLLLLLLGERRRNDLKDLEFVSGKRERKMRCSRRVQWHDFDAFPWRARLLCTFSGAKSFSPDLEK
jgi:hypothetical protein